jgi:hypothetical protein
VEQRVRSPTCRKQRLGVCQYVGNRARNGTQEKGDRKQDTGDSGASVQFVMFIYVIVPLQVSFI